MRVYKRSRADGCVQYIRGQFRGSRRGMSVCGDRVDSALIACLLHKVRVR